MDDAVAATFPTFGHILRALGDAAMVVVRQAATDKDVPLHERTRTYAVLSLIVRRVIVVSVGVDRRRVLDAVPSAGATALIDRELAALHKADIDAHQARLQTMIDADDAEDDWSGVPRLPPARLVAELCRDFGVVVQSLPPRYLETLPSEILALTGRAAAASLSASGPSGRKNPRLSSSTPA